MIYLASEKRSIFVVCYYFSPINDHILFKCDTSSTGNKPPQISHPFLKLDIMILVGQLRNRVKFIILYLVTAAVPFLWIGDVFAFDPFVAAFASK